MKKKINPYALVSLDELSKDQQKGLDNAMSEISDYLNSEGGGPITKKKLKAYMAGDTKPLFETALTYMALNKMIYMTTKGYVNNDYELSIDEQVAHITWCLKINEFSSNQYLMDKKVLLDVPNMLMKLKDKYGSDYPKWRDKVLDIEKQSQMMGNTLKELSEAYIEISAAAEKLLPKEKPKKIIGTSFEDLKKWSKDYKKTPYCKHCGSKNGRLIGKFKDTFDCNECGRKS